MIKSLVRICALLVCGLLLLSVSPLILPATAKNATPIQHIIILTQENHSFDNYFGTYPTANGTLKDSVSSQLQSVNGIPNGECLPHDGGCVSPHLASGPSTPNPIEGQLAYEKDWNNGAMDGFAQNSGPQSMTYYDYHQIPAYWNYAEQYGLANNYFAPVLSTTLPNRLMLIEGDSQFTTTDLSSPTFSRDLFLTLAKSFTKTIFFQLASSDISFGYFDFFSSPPLSEASSIPFNPAKNIQNASSFFNDLTSGNLPQVSFVNSLGSKTLYELSPLNVTAGQQWTVSVVNAVMKSAYWDSSAIFVTWDEGGGYYDHVAPPQVLRINHNFTNPLIGYGQRVPLLVISPYAKENYVSQTTLNHMSLIKFIEYNFGLTALNQNVANSNLPLDFFDFTSQPRSPIILSSSGIYSYNIYPTAPQTPIGQLSYSRTGSYTGPETLSQGSSESDPVGFITGIFAGTFQLINNLVSNNVSQITLHQIYSLGYLIVIIVALLVIFSIARRVGRRRKKQRTP